VDTVDADGDLFDESDAPGLTRLAAHQPGWTIFENLYLSGGTLWVVTYVQYLLKPAQCAAPLRLTSNTIHRSLCSDDPSDYPEMRLMTSTGLPANGDPGNEAAREPKGDELMFITPGQARKKWGDRVWEMEGVTWLFNDGQCESVGLGWVATCWLTDR
jgi:hypothetical protein